MSTDSTFTILSVGAPLVEVDGDGPANDVAGGLHVPDGVPVKAAVDLVNAPVRRFRVDAAPAIHTTVAITDAPMSLGALLRVRRCVPLVQPSPWWRFYAVARWPRLRAVLKRHAPNLLALWYLLTDDDPPAAPSATNGARAHKPFSPVKLACSWRDVGHEESSFVEAHGGDLVVVNFVNA
jgi:hypothetical protein